MAHMPTSPDVDIRNGGYYLAGTRISLDSVAYGLKRGQTIEEIHADFPALQSREKLERAIAFIHAYPSEVDAYLKVKEQLWKEARKLNPPEFEEKFRRYREQRAIKQA